MLYGAQTSLIIGVVANGLALVIGTLVGITAGFFRGWIGGILMRFTDLMMAFPALLLAICLAAIFQPSLWIVALVIALVNWVQTARVIYTETTSLATRDFIAAERTLGAGTGASCSATSCRIFCRRSSSGARWASRRRSCWRRR
jgi:peptide/nickel transport system permease protein